MKTEDFVYIVETEKSFDEMGNFRYGFGYWNFLNVLFVVLLIELLIFVYLGIVKLRKDLSKKKNSK